jgi:hypothetical protein
VTVGLLYVITVVRNAADGTVGAGQTTFETDGVTAIAIAVAPLIWIVLTAAVAWTASRKQSFALSVFAGVLALILATMCALTILAAFTMIPLVGLAFGVPAILLLAAIFTERAEMKAERKRRELAQMPAPEPAPAIASPETPTAP